ncbi:MAG: rhomboid family intramembrane serine protease [Sedimentisphaerales bacterium]|nr:rhomboid family intramembrane serine protease [Sedimentisphaerales bacterium]
MGIYDREYSHSDYQSPHQRVQFTMPTITPVVKWLLIINIVTFVFEVIFFADESRINPIEQWFSVFPVNWLTAIQIWRWITYQFLHADAAHLLFNMFVLFQFGPLLERQFGSRQFLIFYLCAGAAGGLVYTLLFFGDQAILVGASGAILGLLGAGAVLYPNLRILFMLIIPMSLRMLAILLVVISVMMFLAGHNAGGEAAHLAGLAVGVMYVLWRPWLNKTRLKIGEGRWQRKIERERSFQSEVDRILKKVHDSGIASLTNKEKQILKEATLREQQER